MKKFITLFFICLITVFGLLFQIPVSFANEQLVSDDIDYIYFDLNAGLINITGTTYTGYVFETTSGTTTTKKITGTHSKDNNYYVYQSNASNKSTTGLINSTYVIPEYSAVTYQSKSWANYITNNTEVKQVITNWDTAAANIGRTSTSNYIDVVGSVQTNLTIDNIWSSYQVNKNSGTNGGIAVHTTDAATYLNFVGDNRLGNVSYTSSLSDTSTITFNGTGTLTIADMSNQIGYNHYNSIIGASDGSDNSNGIIINGGTIYAGAVLEDNCSAIGGGGNGTGVVTINGGTITAVTSSAGAAIGGGIGESSLGGNANITITGGTIYAYNFGYASTMSGVKRFIPAVAIGGGSSCLSTGNKSTIINISGGTIYAQCSAGSAIGGGSSSTKDGGSATINISGATTYITAVSLENTEYGLPAGSGIGGGTGGTGGNGGNVTLNISNGTILTQNIGGGGTNNASGTIGSATVDISGGTIQGRFIMDSTNLSEGNTCYFKMTNGIIDNEASTFSSTQNDGMAVHIVGDSGTGESVAQFMGGTIKNCNGQFGGAIYIAHGGSFEMSGGTIEICSAKKGGAVYLDGGSFSMSNGFIKNCIASDTSEGFGGAVYMSSGTFNMSGGTISDCNSTQMGGAVYMSSGTYYMYDGIITTCESVTSGGAVYLADGEFFMEGGTITKCTVEQTGGAVYLLSGKFTMDNGTLSYCETSNSGGAVYLADGEFFMEGGTITQCVVDNFGGAVYLLSGKFTMDNGTLSNCETSNSGGAVYLSDGEFLMSGGKVQDCTALKTGGSIYLADGTFTMTGGDISNCTTTDENLGYGGAVYLSLGEVVMTAGNISNCSASYGGGAIYVNGGNFELSGTGLIDSCRAQIGGGVYVNNGDINISRYGTIKGCKASNSGGGMVVFSGNVTIDGGSLLNNQADINGGGIYASSDTTNLLINAISGSIVGNIALGSGGAIYVEVGDGYSAQVSIGLQECGGKDETHVHPVVTDNTATETAGGAYLEGVDVTLNVYCGKLNQNIAINDSGAADINQSGGNVTIFGGEIGENVSVSGGSFSNETSEDIAKITIIYNSNFGENQTSSVTISEGMKISLPSNLFTRPDYLLIGWSLVKNPTTEQIIQLNQSYIVPGEPSEINMYAVWRYRGSGTIITPTISAGKEYINVSGTTSVVISSESALSMLFLVEGMIPNAYTNRTLVFTNALCVNTTILLIDYSQAVIQYYSYIVTNSTTSISLTSFVKLNSNTTFVEPTTTTALNEKYIFIIDFPKENVSGANEVKLYRYATNEDEAPIIQNVAYVLTESRTFSFGLSSNSIKLGENLSITYQPNNPIGNDDFYNSKAISVVIKSGSNSTMPNDTKLNVDLMSYELNSSGTFILLLGGVKQQNSLSLNFESEILKSSGGSVNITIEFWLSATTQNSPMSGELLQSNNITLNTNPIASLKINSFGDRVFYNSELDSTIALTYQTQNITGYAVKIKVQKKNGNNYQNITTAIKSVDGIETNETGVFDISSQTDGVLNILLSKDMPAGTYRIVISATNADAETIEDVFNFIISA